MKRKSAFLILLVVIVVMVLFVFPSSAYATYTGYMSIDYSFADEPVTFNLGSGLDTYSLEIFGVSSVSYSIFTGPIVGESASVSAKLDAGDYGIVYRMWNSSTPGNVYNLQSPLSISPRPYIIINSPLNETKINTIFLSKNDALTAAENQVRTALNSPEAQIVQAGLSDGQFIDYLYSAIFHRVPDEAGYNNWLNALNNGLSRAGVINYFINSPEFEVKYILPVEGSNNITVGHIVR